MRQFRMPLQHTNNLTKFKRQVGNILRNLNTFGEKEKFEAFSYLKGCISSKGIAKRKSLCKTNIRKKFRKYINKCTECGYTNTAKNSFHGHLKTHSGFPLSCRLCRNSFNNSLLFQWHLNNSCKSAVVRTASYSCSECPRKFFLKQNLERHAEGHKRNNCTYCNEVITNRKHLIQHLYDVHSIKLERALFKCSICDKRYVKKRSLNYHKQQHFENKYVCLDCGTIFENSEDIGNHKKEHDNQKKFECIKCDQKFMRRQQYLLHMKKHDNYKCLTCTESFASKLKMLLHKRKGHSVEGLKPKYCCPDCGKEFFQNSKFITHIRKHSEDKPTLFCQYCDKTFQSPYAYYKHSITVSHEKSSPETSSFVCESCGSQFPKKYLLDQHYIRIHNNNKQYVTCEFCSYKTKNKTNMKRHRETHITNGIRFICDKCGKYFNNEASLKGHLSYIHSQNKQFKCSECEKTFKRNSELVRHQETHSDIRPHECKLCGQSYKRLTHLRRHEKSSHKIEFQSKTTTKLRIDSDGSLVPVELVQEQNQRSQTSVKKTTSTVIPLVLSEPLALVKRKDSGQISITKSAEELSLFESINTNQTNLELNSLKHTILDVCMMDNSTETLHFSQYTNDQFIQEYIGFENVNFDESN